MSDDTAPNPFAPEFIIPEIRVAYSTGDLSYDSNVDLYRVDALASIVADDSYIFIGSDWMTQADPNNIIIFNDAILKFVQSGEETPLFEPVGEEDLPQYDKRAAELWIEKVRGRPTPTVFRLHKDNNEDLAKEGNSTYIFGLVATAHMVEAALARERETPEFCQIHLLNDANEKDEPNGDNLMLTLDGALYILDDDGDLYRVDAFEPEKLEAFRNRYRAS